METYASKQDYVEALEARARLPEGFSCATAAIEFAAREKRAEQAYAMNLSLIAASESSRLFGAVFTTNAFPGAPVLIGCEALTLPAIRGFIINNRIANVGVECGETDGRRLMQGLAELTGGAVFLPASTGIIGWRLPTPEMLEALPGLVDSLEEGSVLPVARAIMTTDAYPKVRSVPCGAGRIVGVAKGAGMIEPRLATMLAFLLTDVGVTRRNLRRRLAHCVGRTFNRISVDGDQSTSDAVYLLSSGKKPPVSAAVFEEALMRVCAGLAEDVVRNGEGTTHVIRVTVRGASGKRTAEGAARAVVNSPLVKTAIFGDDPNVGRILGALGDYFGSRGGRLDARSLIVVIGGEAVFGAGRFELDADKAARLSRYLKERRLESCRQGYPAHDRTVDITIDLGRGRGGRSRPQAVMLGSDLSYDYVRENADYTS